jgi:hypothetical protein
MRHLIVLADPSDKQAMQWHFMALASGAVSDFLCIANINSEWSIELRSDRIPAVILPNKCRIEISPGKACWYLRGPTCGDIRVREQIQLLHQLVSQLYDCGDYFLSPHSEVLTESKPLQLSLAPCSFPQTRLWMHKLVITDMNWITKSISHIRSIVVNVAHPDLMRNSDGETASPVMFQRFCEGNQVKVHCYYTRYQTWRLFAVSANSNAVDYRYSIKTKYTIEPIQGRWYHYAQHLYNYLQIRFFDFDLVVFEGNDTFLEVNTSPAPIYFERIFSEYRYSASVLLDWLNESL